MWWWRKVRKANIPKYQRDIFERYGEFAVSLALTNVRSQSGIVGVAARNLQILVENPAGLENATAWLTERNDTHERGEQRREAVEWAVLIFVGIEVLNALGVLNRLTSWVSAVLGRL